MITAAIMLAEAAVLLRKPQSRADPGLRAAARGGSTRTDVIISDAEIYYPKVNQPNILVCLTQAAYNKFDPMIRPGGLLLTDTRYVQNRANGGCPAKRAAHVSDGHGQVGKPIVFNICMLGAVTALTRVVRPGIGQKILADRIPARLPGDEPEGTRIGFRAGSCSSLIVALRRQALQRLKWRPTTIGESCTGYGRVR